MSREPRREWKGLGDNHSDRENRWVDKYGDTWYWNADVGSWVCEGKPQAAVIWTYVPPNYGPFTNEELA